MHKFTWLMVLTLGLGGLARAQDPVVATSDIVAEQKAIRVEVEGRTGRFKDMPTVKCNAILANQNKLFALLDGKSTTAELNPTEKTEASNALEAIKASIANKDDERLVCAREKATGSNRVTRVCKSVAQIRLEREQARTNMQGNQGACNSAVCKPD